MPRGPRILRRCCRNRRRWIKIRSELPPLLRRDRDSFSYRAIAYVACFVLAYNALFQFASFGGSFAFWYLAWALIFAHICWLIWLMIVAAWYLRPRRLISLFCTIPLALFLQLLWPDSGTLHFWLHKNEFASKVAMAQPHDGHLSIIFDSEANMSYGLGGLSSICTTEIIYDNSDDGDVIAQTSSGRAVFKSLGDGFYLRYPPCG